MVIAPPTKMESRGTDEPPPAEEDENSAWEPQKLRKVRGHTVRWWPERRGKGTRGEDSTITHSVTSPTVGWQQIYAKGKQPRALRVSNQGGKSSGAASSCKARAQTQRPNCNWRSRSAAQQLQKGALKEALLKARDTLYFFVCFWMVNQKDVDNPAGNSRKRSTFHGGFFRSMIV